LIIKDISPKVKRMIGKRMIFRIGRITLLTTSKMMLAERRIIQNAGS
jgi:hypothetical protein